MDPLTQILLDADKCLAPRGEELSILRALLQRRAGLLHMIELDEATLKINKTLLREIEESQFPGAMDELGVTAVTVSGVKLKLANVITASLTNPEKRAAAMAWLRANDHDGIVTREVSVSFGKGMREHAEQAAEIIRSAGYVPVIEDNVNTTSFKALLTEAMEKGAGIPGDEAGVFVVRKVVVGK